MLKVLFGLLGIDTPDQGGNLCISEVRSLTWSPVPPTLYVWTGGETRCVTVREISQEKWEAWGEAPMEDK